MGRLDFPYHFDGRGRTADTSLEEHVRDLIEQVLFTSPGERVNRPAFGCGLLQMVFAPNSEELAAATQFLIQGALQDWLGERILVHEVVVEANDAELRVTIPYTLRDDGLQRVAEFVRPGGGP
jgi:hypothetical protein